MEDDAAMPATATILDVLTGVDVFVDGAVTVVVPPAAGVTTEIEQILAVRVVVAVVLAAWLLGIQVVVILCARGGIEGASPWRRAVCIIWRDTARLHDVRKEHGAVGLAIAASAHGVEVEVLIHLTIAVVVDPIADLFGRGVAVLVSVVVQVDVRAWTIASVEVDVSCAVTTPSSGTAVCAIRPDVVAVAETERMVVAAPERERKQRQHGKPRRATTHEKVFGH
jgi:hypothetical protein